MAEQYGVQRATVRDAYHILEREGIIEIRERSGRYIRDIPELKKSGGD